MIKGTKNMKMKVGTFKTNVNIKLKINPKNFSHWNREEINKIPLFNKRRNFRDWSSPKLMEIMMRNIRRVLSTKRSPARSGTILSNRIQDRYKEKRRRSRFWVRSPQIFRWKRLKIKSISTIKSHPTMSRNWTQTTGTPITKATIKTTQMNMWKNNLDNLIYCINSC